MNMSKTKYMVIGNRRNNEINRTIYKEVNSYKYFGIKITSDGKIDTEIETRIDNMIKCIIPHINKFIRRPKIISIQNDSYI